MLRDGRDQVARDQIVRDQIARDQITSSKSIRIGVVSDTHVPHRVPHLPERLFTLLQGSDLILHAGDLEDPAILAELGRIAPVHAVRGNLHWQYSLGIHDQMLPAQLTLPLGRHTLWMTHGHINFGYSVLDKFAHMSGKPRLDLVNKMIVARLMRLKPKEADIVVFGHSHSPYAVQHASARAGDRGALYFNPGSTMGAGSPTIIVEPPSLGFLTLAGDGTIRHEWVLL